MITEVLSFIVFQAIASFKESSDRLQNVEREKDEIQKELDELKVKACFTFVF